MIILIFSLLILHCFGEVLNDPNQIHISLNENVSADYSSINIMWTNAVKFEDAIVKFGLSETKLENEILAKVTTFQELWPDLFIYTATLTDLNYDTTYYYKVGDGTKFSSEYSFKTQPHPLNKKTRTGFAVFGDMGIGEGAPDVIKQLLYEKSSDNIDLIVHAGDLSYAFENKWKLDKWFSMIQPLAAYIPYHVVTGNRDFEEIEHRFKMPQNGKENWYYSFNYGAVHFVCLSIKQDFTVGSEQYNWIENDLKKAQDLVQDSTSPISWIFFYGHQPPYSSSAGHDGSNRGIRDVYDPLFEIYNVDLAFWGDDHGYERTYPVYQGKPDLTQETRFVDPKHTIHMVVGTGGIGLDEFQEEHPVWSFFREVTHGFAHIVATDDELFVVFKRKDGSKADSFSVQKTANMYAFGRYRDNQKAQSFTGVYILMLLVALGVAYYVKSKKTLPTYENRNFNL